MQLRIARTLCSMCAGGALIAISACGSAATSASQSASSRASASVSSSAEPSSKATTLALKPGDFPAGGPQLTQVSDGLLNNVPDTLQRVFANADNTYRVEDDLIIDSSASQAKVDLPSFEAAAKRNVASVSSTPTPPGLGSDAVEYVGSASNGYSVIAIAWVNGRVLAAVLFESTSSQVDQGYAEQTAQAQNAALNSAG